MQVWVTGFEPATFWPQTRRSSQAELHPVAQGIDESNACFRIWRPVCYHYTNPLLPVKDSNLD